MIRTLCALVFLAIGCSYEKDDEVDDEVDVAHAQMQGQVDQLRLALKERPASPLIEYKIGRLFAEYGLMDSARAAFERSLALHEAFPEAHNDLGYIQKRLGDLDGAGRSYERAVAIDSSFVEAYNNLGQVYKAQGYSEKAIKVFRRAIALRSDFAVAYVNLARVYETEGKRQEEAEIWRSYADRFGKADKYSRHARERLLDLTERTAASE